MGRRHRGAGGPARAVPRWRRPPVGGPAAALALLAGVWWRLVPGTTRCYQRKAWPPRNPQPRTVVLENEGQRGFRELQLRRQKQSEVYAREAASTWRREGSPLPESSPAGPLYSQNVAHGDNPLLSRGEFLKYGYVVPEMFERALKKLAFDSEDNWLILADLLAKVEDKATPDFLEPMQLQMDEVDLVWREITHVKDVVDGSSSCESAWRLSREWYVKLQQQFRTSDAFLPALRSILRHPESGEAQRRAAALLITQFQIATPELFNRYVADEGEDKKIQVMNTKAWLMNLTEQWEINVARSRVEKAILVRNRTELEGLPQFAMDDAVAAARGRGYARATSAGGPWLVRMDEAGVGPILRHASDATFREYVHQTFARIAFKGGSGHNDNTPILENILANRREFASMVGQPSFVDVVMPLRMATQRQVFAFLQRIRRSGMPVAQRELAELRGIAESQGAQDVDQSDLAYWRERLLEDRLGLREEYVREHFPLPAVLEGLFGLLTRLFGVEVIEAPDDVDVWDEHVRFYRVREAATGEAVASFFLDAHRRHGQKRPGFWVHRIHDYSELRRHSSRHGPRRPAVHVVCDLARPGEDGTPALLSMDEVARLFHTVGLALRTLLSTQPEGFVAGTNGLELDAVAIPAHLLARFAYEERTLRSIGRHYKTGDALPEGAVQMLAKSRTFHNAIPTLRRAAYAQIDLDLHVAYDRQDEMTVYDVVKLIEAQFSVIPPRVENHEVCSWPFSDPELAGGTYADLWSEALAADVFSKFEDAGLDDDAAVAEAGRLFREAVLAPGGGRAPTGGLTEFLGRAPAFAPFLGHLGLGGAATPGNDAAEQARDEIVDKEDTDFEEYEAPQG